MVSSIRVVPARAAAAGCTASHSVYSTGSDSQGSWTQYKLTASSAGNWYLDHFTIRIKSTEHLDGVKTIYNRCYKPGSSTFDPNQQFTENWLRDEVWDFRPVIDDYGTSEITDVEAVFVWVDPWPSPTPGENDYRVYGEAAASQDAARGGCTASASPSSQSGRAGDVATVTFTATAAAGWRFREWASGATSATHTMTTTFGPQSEKTLTDVAYFEEEPTTPGEDEYIVYGEAVINQADPPREGCTAVASPTSQSGRLGETATVGFTATAAPGWRFRYWASDLSTNPSHTLSTTFGPAAAKTLSDVAYFERDPIPCTVTTEAFPANAGTTSGGGSFMSGDTCTVTAEENCSPWTFVRWDLSDGRMSRDRTYSFKVTGNVTCTARFSHTNTGVPYYEADGGGGILCAADGSILYDG